MVRINTDADGFCHAEVNTKREQRFTAPTWAQLCDKLVKALYHCSLHNEQLEKENRILRMPPNKSIHWTDRFQEEKYSAPKGKK